MRTVVRAKWRRKYSVRSTGKGDRIISGIDDVIGNSCPFPPIRSVAIILVCVIEIYLNHRPGRKRYRRFGRTGIIHFDRAGDNVIRVIIDSFNYDGMINLNLDFGRIQVVRNLKFSGDPIAGQRCSISIGRCQIIDITFGGNVSACGWRARRENSAGIIHGDSIRRGRCRRAMSVRRGSMARNDRIDSRTRRNQNRRIRENAFGRQVLQWNLSETIEFRNSARHTENRIGKIQFGMVVICRRSSKIGNGNTDSTRLSIHGRNRVRWGKQFLPVHKRSRIIPRKDKRFIEIGSNRNIAFFRRQGKHGRLSRDDERIRDCQSGQNVIGQFAVHVKYRNIAFQQTGIDRCRRSESGNIRDNMGMNNRGKRCYLCIDVILCRRMIRLLRVTGQKYIGQINNFRFNSGHIKAFQLKSENGCSATGIDKTNVNVCRGGRFVENTGNHFFPANKNFDFRELRL